jgi:hypothetical protein
MVVRWRWSSSGQYSAQSAYLVLQQGQTALPGAKLIWDTWSPLRVKLFLWLACRGRIWTADRRRRPALDAHDACWLCDQADETADHLIATCSVAKEVYWLSFSWARCECIFDDVTPKFGGKLECINYMCVKIKLHTCNDSANTKYSAKA